MGLRILTDAPTPPVSWLSIILSRVCLLTKTNQRSWQVRIWRQPKVWNYRKFAKQQQSAVHPLTGSNCAVTYNPDTLDIWHQKGESLIAFEAVIYSMNPINRQSIFKYLIGTGTNMGRRSHQTDQLISCLWFFPPVGTEIHISQHFIENWVSASDLIFHDSGS